MTTDASSRLSPTEATPERRFLDYARSGNKEIVQALIQEYANRSYNQARRIIGRDDGAEDAVQEAYLLLVRTADRYTGDVPFAAWLGRLVGSSAINYRQRMHRDRNLSALSDGGAAAMDHQSAKSGCVEEPEIEAVRTALDSLPDRYRAPLTLYYFGGMNQDETAQALRTSAGTVASQLSRGLELLRQKLGRAGYAVTSAGLLAVFANIPTYAAPPSLTSSLIAIGSERLAAASRRLSEGKASLLQNAGIFKVGAIAAVIILAAVAAFVSGGRVSNLKEPEPRIAVARSPAGLIAHWTMDEGQGSVVRSSPGSDQVGTLVNAPAWTPGKIGRALSFDGASQYAQVPGPAFNAFTDQMTVAAWVFHRSQVQDYAVIVGRRSGTDFGDLWTLMYGLEDQHNYIFQITTARGESRVAGPSSVPDLNTWVHFAGVYDGAQLHLYRNGIPVASAPCSGTIPTETSHVLIGACERGDSGLGEFLHGAVDEVRIYRRALSASEIAALAR
jgi:RNA polymerase sigma factor (sigma-70 family)